jgi:AmmeMemoRadiSam system protein B
MTATVRRPAVAGTFYPSSPARLESWLDELITDEDPGEELLACVAPHAGYRYSGRVAGKVFGNLDLPRRVVVMGPNHTGMGAAVSVASHDVWETPLGPCPLDRELAGLLLECSPAAELDSQAHWREHSIEVMLPFLQTRRPDVRVLPICLKHLSMGECVELGECLARVIEGIDEPVGIVASSDMTHHEPDEAARARDRLAIDAALTLRPAALYETVHSQRITMCGVIPATVAMVAAGELGATTARLVAYATSGDAGGDPSAVVGYAGICFSRGEPTADGQPSTAAADC